MVFYHGLLEKYIAVFGSLFNDIYVPKFNEDGTLKQQSLVPCEWAPREKMLARVEGDPDLNRAFAVLLPRMTYEITGIKYDSDRKKSTVNVIRQKKTSETNKNYYESVWEPVPYNISFKLSIHGKEAEDCFKIAEQILPYFTPDWTISLFPLEDMPDNMIRVPIVHEGEMEYDDDYIGKPTDSRRVVVSLNFIMKTYFYGPVSKAKIIKIAKVNLYSNTVQENPDVTITIRPGLTANGEPTSNAEMSIPYFKISENDNYGYIVTKEEHDL